MQNTKIPAGGKEVKYSDLPAEHKNAETQAARHLIIIETGGGTIVIDGDTGHQLSPPKKKK